MEDEKIKKEVILKNQESLIKERLLAAENEQEQLNLLEELLNNMRKRKAFFQKFMYKDEELK